MPTTYSLTESASRNPMLRAIIAVLLILWLLGFTLHVAGGLIHLLIVVGLIALVFDVLGRRKA